MLCGVVYAPFMTLTLGHGIADASNVFAPGGWRWGEADMALFTFETCG